MGITATGDGVLASGLASEGTSGPGVPAWPLPGSPLIDRLQRRIDYLRISVTDRCNLRCTYCLPEDGVAVTSRADLLTFEDIVRLVGCFARLGVRRLRLTGGEPTVRRDLPRLVRMLRQVPGIDDLALSTNGRLAGRAGRSPPRRRRRSPERQPRHAGPRAFRPHHPRWTPGRGCWPGSRRRAPPGSPRSRPTPWRSAASTTTRSRPSPPMRGTAVSFPVSSNRCRWPTARSSCPEP